MVVDIDARIVHINPVAFDIVDKSPTEVLNIPVLDIFPASAKPKLADALKQVFQLPEKNQISFLSDFNDRSIRTTVSTIFRSARKVGWVLALEDKTAS